MIYFIKFYSQVLTRPSSKFFLNLFFLHSAVSLRVYTILNPYLFIPHQILKIKLLKTNTVGLWVIKFGFIIGIYLSLGIMLYFI